MTYKTFGYFPNYRIYGSNYQPKNINWDLLDIGFYDLGGDCNRKLMNAIHSNLK